MSRTIRKFHGIREDYIEGFDPSRDGIDWFPRKTKQFVKKHSNKVNRREWLYEMERKKFNARQRFIWY